MVLSSMGESPSPPLRAGPYMAWSSPVPVRPSVPSPACLFLLFAPLSEKFCKDTFSTWWPPHPLLPPLPLCAIFLRAETVESFFLVVFVVLSGFVRDIIRWSSTCWSWNYMGGCHLLLCCCFVTKCQKVGSDYCDQRVTRERGSVLQTWLVILPLFERYVDKIRCLQQVWH